MRSAVARRTALAASAAALALLATACGGDDKADKGGSGEDKGGAAASSAPAAKALTAAELEKAALTQADVKSGKVTEKVSGAEAAAQDKVKADDAACAPIAYVQNGSYVGKPSATVLRKWTGEPKKPAAGASDEEKFLAGMDASSVMVTLASYENGGAEQAMKDLSAAAEKCAGGFSITVAGEKTKVLKVATTDAPKGGDEALAMTVTIQADEGIEASSKGVVVRKGATLAYFPAFNLAAAATGKDFDFPTEIVDAQLTKLG
ncbi:hypothetical protein [Streptomyces sp. NPDC058751]|uniref:hypothetical protein n=1 Tax=Streptomyces sp. NPDC058751 TaxID=3346623 RepID=UPI0036995D49